MIRNFGNPWWKTTRSIDESFRPCSAERDAGHAAILEATMGTACPARSLRQARGEEAAAAGNVRRIAEEIDRMIADLETTAAGI